MKLWPGRFWAADTFEHGGDVVDADRAFVMRDKVQHFICAALLFAAVSRFVSPAWAFRVVAAGGLAVEATEGTRYALWTKRGLAGAWPFLCDKPSWRDLLTNMAGATFAWLLL